ncbi:hypothetical protein BY458DRAFT_506295 [Sporodiniella umbellata]|nr:hypothetical protein BY458DRAFT_506295 [Sporodiniella umbellata]
MFKTILILFNYLFIIQTIADEINGVEESSVAYNKSCIIQRVSSPKTVDRCIIFYLKSQPCFENILTFTPSPGKHFKALRHEDDCYQNWFIGEADPDVFRNDCEALKNGHLFTTSYDIPEKACIESTKIV